MKNNGLFSSLFIEELKDSVKLDDAAQGRMATLAQTWRTRNTQDSESLWESFLKQALSYLEFVPPVNPTVPGIYPLYEDYNFSKCISALYLAPPESDIDNTSVGSFYPAKLLSQLKERKLNWGILTDGASWRLYSTKSSRPYEDYVELPLEEALEESDEAEYGLFEAFFHKECFLNDELGMMNDEKKEKQEIYHSKLDFFRKESERILTEKVKTPFLAQVDEVLQYICNGFIFDTQKSGEEYTEEERGEIFESAVKLIYRCLFLFYAEARRLLPSDPDKADLYRRHSIQALCEEARKFRWGERRDTDQYDLWKHLKGLVNAVNDGDTEYGIMGYNGGLFDDEEERFLGQHQLRNDFLSRALYLLAFVEPFDNESDGEYAIPYEDLEVRHLGELYENILEYTVQLADADRIRRRTKKGVEMLLASQTTKKAGDRLIKKGDVYFGESALERKQTGSYYTPESLVRFLNEKTIIQPLYQTFEQNYRQRFNEFLEQADNGHDDGTRRGAAQSAAALVERFVIDAVLNFKVCDPAMGSGHFLVDAANQMSGLVIALLEEVPHVEGITVSVTSRPNDWRRRITRHCIYGVDLNPLAVNLTKLSLWLNCFAIEHKLTFLDHHVRCGNSLIGIRSLNQLASIPERKKESKKKKDPQRLLFDYNDLSSVLAEAAQGVASITQIDEDDTDTQKAVLDEALGDTSNLRPLADLFTAYLMDPDIPVDDYKEIFERLANGKSVANTLNLALPEILESVGAYRDWHHFYHWPLEFPDVFGPDAVHGFSATVGNPPWDRLRPDSQDFFVRYDPKFRSYSKQQAIRASKTMMQQHDNIKIKWEEFKAKIFLANSFLGSAAHFSFAAKKDMNLYKFFLNLSFGILSPDGYMGIVVPNGICSDQGCTKLRQLIFERSQINYIYGYENRWPKVFISIEGRNKFVLLGLQKGKSSNNFKCAFSQHDPRKLDILDKKAMCVSLEMIRATAPDTLSIMEFKDGLDLEIIKKLYSKFSILGNIREGNGALGFGHELSMTADSSLFKGTDKIADELKLPSYDVFSKKKWLNQSNYTNSSDHSVYIPLYEGKQIWMLNSNYGTPAYYLSIDDLKKHKPNIYDRVKDNQLCRWTIRTVRRNTDQRTLISSVLPPYSIHGNNLTSIGNIDSDRVSLFYSAISSSHLMDYILRKKVFMNINVFYILQLPFPQFKSPFNREIPSEPIIIKYLSPIVARAAMLVCNSKEYESVWRNCYYPEWSLKEFWYPKKEKCNLIDNYGPLHEVQIRKSIENKALLLNEQWNESFPGKDTTDENYDSGDRAQLRAEIDAYVAHLYGLSRDDFSYILDTFPVLKKKEKKAFGEFMSKRKCLEEYDRIGKIMNAE